MRQFLFFISLFATQISFSQRITDSSFNKPMFWYTINDPWAMFIGSDGPLITVYESGKIIYWKDKKYHLAELPKSDVDEIITELHLKDTFFSKSKYIEASYSTDQPTYVLRTNFDTVKYFTVYGFMGSKEGRKNIPKQLVDIYEFALNFDNENSEIWLPDKIEIMLSDFSHSKDSSLKWSDYFPDLINPKTITRPNGMTSIFLDKKYFNTLVELLKKEKQTQAIEINGKKYYAEYRFPLPNLY